MKEESIIIKIWRIIYPMLIYMGISFIISIVAMMVIGFKFVLSSNGDVSDINMLSQLLTEEVYKYAMLMTLVTAVIATPILYFFYRGDKKRQKATERSENPQMISYLYVVVLALVSALGVNNLLDLSHLIELFPGFEEVAKALYGGNIIVEILAVVVMAPLVEELLFRGIIYKRLRRDIKPAYAIVVSALLFGLYHMNVVQGLYAFVIGLLMAYIYEKYKNLAAPILFHGAANGISVILTETTVLDFLYSSTGVILATTVVEVMILGLMVYVIHKKINIKLIPVEEKISEVM